MPEDKNNITSEEQKKDKLIRNIDVAAVYYAKLEANLKKFQAEAFIKIIGTYKKKPLNKKSLKDRRKFLNFKQITYLNQLTI